MTDNSEGHLHYLQEVRSQVVDVCQSMLREEIGLLVGVRKLTSLHFQLSDETDEDFLPIINFEAQTDDLPIGNQRQYYSEKLLLEMDMRYAKFESMMKQEIFEACQRLVKRFSVQ